MNPRRKISGDLVNMAAEMSEGNPGALHVIVEILRESPTNFMFLLDADDMNIRGPQIWIGYKDFAKNDIEVFKAALRSRDPEMVETINREFPEQKAVTSGASFVRPA